MEKIYDEKPPILLWFTIIIKKIKKNTFSFWPVFTIYTIIEYTKLAIREIKITRYANLIVNPTVQITI